METYCVSCNNDIGDKLREIGNLENLYRNEFDKACFAHDAAYSDSKSLPKKTISGKILKDRPDEIAINCKFDGYQRVFANIVYRFLDKKTGSGGTATSKVGVIVNEQLAKEIHKPVIKKSKRRKVYAKFEDNILAVD